MGVGGTTILKTNSVMAKIQVDLVQYQALQFEMENMKEEIEELKENQLTEESAIKYIYENSDKYEDWIEGSTIYNDLKEKLIEEVEWIGSENKDLKKEIEELKEKMEVIKEKSKPYHWTRELRRWHERVNEWQEKYYRTEEGKKEIEEFKKD